MATHIHVYLKPKKTKDTNFKEEDHPRVENGQFGSGGGQRVGNGSPSSIPSKVSVEEGKTAIAEYGKSAYHDINKLLRNGEGKDTPMKGMNASEKRSEMDKRKRREVANVTVKKLDACFENPELYNVTTKTSTVFRGLDMSRYPGEYEKFLSLKPGDTVSDNAFASTGSKESVGVAFENHIGYSSNNRAVRLIMELPKGTKYLKVPNAETNRINENEKLLNRGVQFEVVSSEETDSVHSKYGRNGKLLIVKVRLKESNHENKEQE